MTATQRYIWKFRGHRAAAILARDFQSARLCSRIIRILKDER